MGAFIDDQPLHLVEHGRVRGIIIGAEGAPGAITRMGGAWLSMVRACTGLVWVRRTSEPSSPECPAI